jgi:hypothetical protein
LPRVQLGLAASIKSIKQIMWDQFFGSSI